MELYCARPEPSTKHTDPLSGVQLNPAEKMLVPNIALKKRLISIIHQQQDLLQIIFEEQFAG